jgi:hypothetical protein
LLPAGAGCVPECSYSVGTRNEALLTVIGYW